MSARYSELEDEGSTPHAHMPWSDARKISIEIDRLKRNLQQSRLTNRFDGSNEYGTSVIAKMIEDAFQQHLAEEQLGYVRERLLIFSGALLVGTIASYLWPGSFRFGWVASALSAHQSDTLPAGGARDSGACSCTETNRSGDVSVSQVGCATHSDEDDWVWCYVRSPPLCAEAIPSSRFPGAAWLLCGAAEPEHLRLLSSTTAPCFIGTLIFALGTVLLRLPPLTRWWAPIVLGSFLGVYECFLWIDVHAFMLYGGLPIRMDGDKLFRTVAAGAWEVGQAFRLMLTMFYVATVCLNSGLDYPELVVACVLGDLSFALAEAVLFFQRSSFGHSIMRELPYLILLLTAASILALWGARRHNRVQRQLFLQSFMLHADVTEKSAAIAMKYTQILALFSNPSVSREQRQGGIRLQPLKLGKEMQYLLRAIPAVYLDIQPAATLVDAGAALEVHRPRIVIFSGHTHNGGLAFEDSHGTLEASGTTASARKFVRMLRGAYKADSVADDESNERALECVFLNACTSLALARLILSSPELSGLTVVCWETITEDGAARRFAQGFCDDLGRRLRGLNGAHPDELPVDIAFAAACRAFEQHGHSWGNPADYIHPRDHPHRTALPDKYWECTGCVPPVQGIVLLLRVVDGEVVEYSPLPGRARTVDDLLRDSREDGDSFMTGRASFISPTSRTSFGPGRATFISPTSQASEGRFGPQQRRILRELRMKTVPRLQLAKSKLEECASVMHVLAAFLCLAVLVVVLGGVFYYDPSKSF
ncbi:hypothetical protein AB1Y20_006248 [Prymnesium parvum]|uniref:CHAT domain-containing protein n=1 Tax=Prymnesium parvum TaxID=97485 RepID=A0AB34J261_PRYPA